MSLKEIILVDEKGCTVTIRSSPDEYCEPAMEGNKYRITTGTRQPLHAILRRLVAEEWPKLKEFGARLVTRIAGFHKESIRK